MIPKGIACKLNVSLPTVRGHLRALLDTTGTAPKRITESAFVFAEYHRHAFALALGGGVIWRNALIATSAALPIALALRIGDPNRDSRKRTTTARATFRLRRLNPSAKSTVPANI